MSPVRLSACLPIAALFLGIAHAQSTVPTRPDQFDLLAEPGRTALAVLRNDAPGLSVASVTPRGSKGGRLEAAADGQSVIYVPSFPRLRDTDSAETFSYVARDADGQLSAATSVSVRHSRRVASFELNLVHAADMEGAGNAIEDAPRFSAVLDALRADAPASSLVLSSGDNYIPGPFYSASADASMAAILGAAGPGRADIQMLDAMGFQASAMGNHEFDEGTARILSLIQASGAYPGAAFPYVSANLSFAGDASLAGRVVPPLAAPQAQSITRSVVFTVAGERIGVLGATTPTLATISSPGAGVAVTPQPFAGTPTPAQLDALAAIIQAEVDALLATGLNKVILLAHMQVLDIERQLATRLRGVDIIIAGGSDSILADRSDRLRAGDTAVGSYPIMSTGADGAPVAIVNTDGQYRYVGRLKVGFNAAGLLLDNTIRPRESGAYATDDEGVAAVGGIVNPRVQEIVDGIESVLIAREGNILGKAAVFLNGARSGLRGEGANFGGVRTEETNLGDLSADANLGEARKVDPTALVSLKNGGGIRNVIGRVEQPAGSTDPLEADLLPPGAIPAAGKAEGDVSQFDVQNALSFNNALSLVTVTGAELKDALEHGLSGSIAAANGRFPQVGGLRLSYDESRTSRTTAGSGRRICSLVVESGSGDIPVVVNGTLLAGAASQPFRMVTLSFLADGGDGYPLTNAQLGGAVRMDLLNAPVLGAGAATFAAPGSEQDALAEFLLANHATVPYAVADTVAASDTRIARASCP
jgi:2',3'-cyclic-nucleotide 2'-phosphodiesterase (5'-nucleotidase family)